MYELLVVGKGQLGLPSQQVEQQKMGQIDDATMAYVRRNVIFADIMNQFIYQGRQVLRPEQLRELDTTALARAARGRGSLQKHRDVLKLVMKTDGQAAYCVLGIENQTEVNYAMTVAVHFGAEPWDGAVNLSELYDCDDTAIPRLAPDYHLNLLDPASMSYGDITGYKTGMREIMQYLKYANDKEQLQAAVNGNERFRSVDRETAEIINLTSGAQLEFEEGEETVDMCKAIEDMRAESEQIGREKAQKEMHNALADIRAEGKAEGEEKNRLENIRSLMETMGFTAKQAMDALRIPLGAREKILTML